MASSTGERLSHEEYARKRQLEEARKAGTAPPEVDDEGHEVNPHVPAFMANAPWYTGATGPGLKHQRMPAAQAALAASEAGSLLQDAPNVRGRVAAAPPPPRWRKGACQNCGATTHDTKSCCERPRARGARWTGADLMPDEAVPAAPVPTYDGKRDRWAGYDPAEHARLASFYEQVERERRERKRAEDVAAVTAAAAAAAAREDADADDREGLVEGSFSETLHQRFDAKTRTTVRNLRLREDTAKYLWNLDPDSAFYDPKTRAMHENPLPGADPAQAAFLGDNALRATGDARRFAEEQLHTLEAEQRGQDTHMLAAPSQAELLHRDFKRKKEQLREQQRAELLARYGGEEHLVPAEEAARVRFAQTEDYVEYSRTGKVVRGTTAGPRKSRWEEDVFINNHTTVWGSWWCDGRWGYACCHSLVKNSYCTGEAGRRLEEQLSAQAQAAAAPAAESEKSLVEERAEAEAGKTARQRAEEARQKAEEEKSKREERLRQALEEEDRRAHRASDDRGDEGGAVDGKKRQRYHSQAADAGEVTEEQMEAYRLRRVSREDPMAAFLASDAREDEEEDKAAPPSRRPRHS